MKIKFTKKIVYLLTFSIILFSKNVNAFISPSTLQLIATSIGSFVWWFFVAFFVFFVVMFKKIALINHKKKMIILFILIGLIGSLFGFYTAKIVHLRELNTFESIEQNQMISYDTCVRENYLKFIPKSNITIMNTSESVSFFTNYNFDFNIVNVDYLGSTRFNDEIVLYNQTDSFNKIKFIETNLDKNVPLILHCNGGGHSSSMIAQYLALKNFSQIYVLTTTPERIQKEMELKKIDSQKYFKYVKSEEYTPLIRVSLSVDKDLLSNKDFYYFYKVDECAKTIQKSTLINNNNSVCMNTLDFDYLKKIGKHTHFVCDSNDECNILQTLIKINNKFDFGYLVVINE